MTAAIRPLTLPPLATVVLALSLQVLAPHAPAQQVVTELPLPKGRIMHGAAVLGDWLYTVGGIVMPQGPDGPDDFTTTVLRSGIGPDGRLGPWEPTTPLPTNRHYIETSTVVHRDRVYVVGGKVGEDYANTVFSTWAGGDGHLLPWIESPPFRESGLAFVTTVVTPGHLHLVGGLGQNGVLSNEVITGAIEADGSIARWEAAPPLPAPMWVHSTVAAGGRLWVWGGLRSYSGDSTDEVYSAALLGSGRIGEWTLEQQRLPTPWSHGVGAAAGNFLISFMPRLRGQDQLSDIWFSQLQPDSGRPGQWLKVSTEIPNRIYFGLATDFRRNRIYMVGGKAKRGVGGPDARVYSLGLSIPATEELEPAIDPGRTSQGGGSTAGTPGTTGTAGGGGGFGAAVAAVRADAIAATSPGSQQVGMVQSAGIQPGAPAPPPASGLPPGFSSYDEARRFAAMPPGRPLLVLFHHPAARVSRQQMEALLAEPARLQAIAANSVLALVDVSDEAQLAQQLGVARTPTWLVWDRDGTFRGKAGAMTMEDLERGAAGL